MFVFITNNVDAHPSKNHKPMVCILEEDRTAEQKQTCKLALFFHRLCKLDQDCTILKLEEQKQEIAKEITDVMQRVANKPPSYTYIVFNEVASEDWAIGGNLLG